MLSEAQWLIFLAPGQPRYEEPLEATSIIAKYFAVFFLCSRSIRHTHTRLDSVAPIFSRIGSELLILRALSMVVLFPNAFSNSWQSLNNR